MANPNQVSLALAAASATNVGLLQSPGAGAILINGAAASGGAATLDTARRVLLTTGGDDRLITYTIIGTNANGQALTETMAGPNATTGYTTQDFKTVTSITHTGSVAGTLTVGTNGIASSPPIMLNFFEEQFNVGIGVVVGGTISFTVEYTYDNPNSPFTGTFPTWFSISALASKSANTDGVLTNPAYAARLTQNSFSTGGTLKAIFIQAGDGA